MQCWPDEREPKRMPMWLAVLLCTLATPMIGVSLYAGIALIMEWLR